MTPTGGLSSTTARTMYAAALGAPTLRLDLAAITIIPPVKLADSLGKPQHFLYNCLAILFFTKLFGPEKGHGKTAECYLNRKTH